MNSAVVVQLAHRFPVAAERLFDAWLTPAQASRFLFRTRTGNVMCCDINPVVGGGFLVTDRRPVADGDESVFDVVHRGRYVEITRPSRLVFDLAVLPYSDEPTRVTVEFKACGAQASELVLTHELGDDYEAEMVAETTRKGWTTMLALMERELFPRRVSLLHL